MGGLCFGFAAATPTYRSSSSGCSSSALWTRSSRCPTTVPFGGHVADRRSVTADFVSRLTVRAFPRRRWRPRIRKHLPSLEAQLLRLLSLMRPFVDAIRSKSATSLLCVQADNNRSMSEQLKRLQTCHQKSEMQTSGQQEQTGAHAGASPASGGRLRPHSSPISRRP